MSTGDALGARPAPDARNLECKARDPDPQRTLAAALALGAADHGTLRQRDTYFPVTHGRLKLREQSPGTAELIHYRRADTPAQRESAYRVVPVPDPAGLRAALEAGLGIAVVVHKRRRLLICKRVRIHLDAVEGLGQFVELEAVLEPGETPADAQPRIARLREALAIIDGRLVPHGYAQLLAADGGA